MWREELLLGTERVLCAGCRETLSLHGLLETQPRLSASHRQGNSSENELARPGSCSGSCETKIQSRVCWIPQC